MVVMCSCGGGERSQSSELTQSRSQLQSQSDKITISITSAIFTAAAKLLRQAQRNSDLPSVDTFASLFVCSLVHRIAQELFMDWDGILGGARPGWVCDNIITFLGPNSPGKASPQSGKVLDR